MCDTQVPRNLTNRFYCFGSTGLDIDGQLFCHAEIDTHLDIWQILDITDELNNLLLCEPRYAPLVEVFGSTFHQISCNKSGREDAIDDHIVRFCPITTNNL